MEVLKPKVSVYIPCYNYGRFLPQAVESILAQGYSEWELIIIDDGSRDETRSIAEKFAAEYPDKIRVVRNERPRGLQYAANRAIEMARGVYIMRLDADDYLDENALLVMVTYLDQHPSVGLVYPNYTYIDEEGRILGIESRKKVGKEVQLLDLPAHGACSMIRKSVLKSIGGYSERYDAQDGYELWLKVLNRYEIRNVSTPLFFYRRHDSSLSHNEERILNARQRIKRDLENKRSGQVKPRVAAVIPAKNTYEHMPNIVLEPIAGKPLIDHTLRNALEVADLGTVVVSTDDVTVADYCRQFPSVISHLRPVVLSNPEVQLSQVVHNAVEQLEQSHDIYPDIVVVLSVHSPLRRIEHIQEAIDTLILYNVDGVISVYEDVNLHYTHGEHGLEVLNPGILRELRLEREALYVYNGAIKALWRDGITPHDLHGKKLGHIVMTREESFQIKKMFDAWLVEHIIRRSEISRGGGATLGHQISPRVSYDPIP